MTQEGFNPETDNTELMIADYQAPDAPAEIIGADYIYVSRSATYTSPLANPVWSLTDAPAEWIVSKDGNCVISIPSDLSLIGKVITLTDGANSKAITIKAVL